MFLLGCLVGFVAALVLVSAALAGFILANKYKIVKVSK